jgi:lactoylglutathione lyase
VTASGPVRITSLFEAHLPVADVARAVGFYRDVVGLETAYEDAERGVAFLWLGTAPMGMRLHVAFAAELDEVLRAPKALAAAGVTPLDFFREEAREPSVIGWMPAAAVYFHDPDGHMLEYLAMLDDAPRPEAGIVTWSDWTAG